MADEVMQSSLNEEPLMVLERPSEVTEEQWAWAEQHDCAIVFQYGRYWITSRDPKKMAAYEQPTF